MRTDCINQVSRAVGRRITAVEARNIEEKLLDAQRRLASRNPAEWRGLSRDDRLRAAADAIGKDIEQAAVVKERNAALQVQAVHRALPDIEQAGKRGFKVLAVKLKQADAYIKGISRESFRQILDTMDFATQRDGFHPVRFICNLETPENTLAFVREVFGKDTGNPDAKAAAKAWLAGVEELRTRFNAAGGEVRRLIYSYLPQPHDAKKVRDAGIGAWVRDVRGKIDRSKYYDETGKLLDDNGITEVLEQMWRTISSDGLNQLEVGADRGISAIASRHAEARELHFAEPEDYVAYLQSYGQGTVFDAMKGHVDRWSRDIGLTETFGPNPEQTFRTLHDTAKQSGADDRIKLATSTDHMWKTLTAELANPESQTLARIAQGLRNIEVAGKLQQTPISAIQDIATYYKTLGFNHLGFWQGTVNLVRAFGKDSARYADLAGLIADSHIADMNIWADNMLGQGFTKRLATATMKASFLDAMTDATRRGFGLTMMGGLAKIAQTPWEKLNKYDRARLKEQGWQPDEWAVMGQATPETWRNTPMLTPAALKAIEGVDESLKQRTISRMLGTIVDESEFASLNPDLVTRSIAAQGTQRGTFGGELWRCVALFKSFPLAMITRHWDRALYSDALTPAGRVAYMATLFPALTLFGAASLLLSDIVNGKDPRDMTGGGDPAQASKFWLAALAKGGGAGFVGDVLLSGVGRQGQSGASAAVNSVAGPVVGSAFELAYDVGLKNVQEAAAGDDTHGKEAAMRWVRGHLPFANLWYGKLALDQAWLNDMQEMIAPGHNDRVKLQAQKQWKQDFWFSPEGDVRAPNLGAAVGDK